MTTPNINEPAAPEQIDATPPNRGYDTKIDSSDPAPISVTLYSIDQTIMEYITDVITPTIIDNGRVVPVPLRYANQERWKTVQKDGFLRDPKNAKLQTPLIVIHRGAIRKAKNSNPVNKYLYITFGGEWNAKNGYDRFAVQNGIRPSQKLHQVMVPDYVELEYEVLIWTETAEQMNTVIEQINVENDEFWGQKNQYKFRITIEEYTDGDYGVTGQIPDGERSERTFFTMKVQAYLLPERVIRNYKANPVDIKTFTAKKIVITTEIDTT